MSFDKQPQDAPLCPACGMAHTCAVETIWIEPGAARKAPDLLKGFRSVLVVSDGNTRALCVDDLLERLNGSGVETAEAFFDQTSVIVPGEEAIGFIQARITPQTDVMIGVGAGVINDLCKHVAGEAGIPYMIIATAPSMDGYASKGAALILRGMKVTLDAPVPRWIIGDTALLARAPLEMIRSGIGDILGKYSCLNDWRIGHAVTGERFCTDIYDRVKRQADAVCDCAEACLLREEDSIGKLMRALVEVGVAMSHMGNSRPASGSEHHLSHFFEIVGILRGVPYLPHGIDVAFSALLCYRLRRYALSLEPSLFTYAFDAPAYRADMENTFGSLACEVVRLQQKAGLYAANRVDALREKWPRLAEILREASDEAALSAMLEKIGLRFEDFIDAYGEPMIRQAIEYAKDLKDRYTVLWLLNDIGKLRDAAKGITL